MFFESIVRLNKPLAKSNEIPRQEATFDKIMESLEEKRSTLVGQTTLPGALFTFCKTITIEKKKKKHIKNRVTVI